MAIEERGYEQQLGPARSAALPMADASAFGADVGRAIGNVGEAIERYQQRQRQFRQNEQASSVGVAFEQAKAEIETYEAAAQRGEVPGIQPGGVGYREMVGQFARERLAKVNEGVSEKAVLQDLAPRLAAYQGDVDHRADLYAYGASAVKTKADAEERGNIVQARMERATTLDEYGQQAHDDDAYVASLSLNPEQRAGVLQHYDVARATGFLTGRARENPNFALQLVDSGHFDFLPGNVRAGVRNMADAQLQRQQQAMKAANAEQVRQDKEQEQILLDDVGRGAIVDPVALSSAAARAEARGDLSRAHDLGVVASVKNKVNTAFGEMPASQISERMGAIERTADWRSKPHLVVEHDQLDTLRTRMREAEPNFANGLDAENPASFAQRQQEAMADMQRRGLAVPQPLGPDDVKRYQDLAKSGLGGQIKVADDLAHFSTPFAMAAARQVDPGNRMLMVATTLTDEARGLVLQGIEAGKMKPGQITPTLVEQRYSRSVGGALARLPEDYQAGVREAAEKIADGLMLKNNQSQLTGKVWDEALHRALGGTWARNGVPQGGMGKWNGKDVLLPYRMSQEDFDKRLSRITTLNGAFSAGGPVTAAELRRYYTPVAVGGGYYHFVDSAGRPLKAKDGSNAALKFSWNGK